MERRPPHEVSRNGAGGAVVGSHERRTEGEGDVGVRGEDAAEGAEPARIGHADHYALQTQRALTIPLVRARARPCPANLTHRNRGSVPHAARGSSLPGAAWSITITATGPGREARADIPASVVEAARCRVQITTAIDGKEGSCGAVIGG